jgi:hypothetical protein
VRDTELRPLGAGELLDRAVTLYVRRFAPIVAVLAVAIVPLVIVDALLEPQTTHLFTDIANVLSAGGNPAAQRAAIAALQGESAPGWVTGLLWVVTAVVRLLQVSAVVAVIAAAYAGTQVTLSAAYTLALRLWPRQLLVVLAFAAFGLIAAVPLLMLYVLMILAVVAVAVVAHAQVVTIAIGAVFALIWIALATVTFACTYMAYNLAAVAVVTEQLEPSAAIGAGLRRAFRRPTAVRSLVAGLIVSALSFLGSLPILGISAAVAALAHAPVLSYAIVAVGQILVEGLVLVFVVVYAADVRVRREGLDLLPEAAPG